MTNTCTRSSASGTQSDWNSASSLLVPRDEEINCMFNLIGLFIYLRVLASFCFHCNSLIELSPIRSLELVILCQIIFIVILLLHHHFPFVQTCAEHPSHFYCHILHIISNPIHLSDTLLNRKYIFLLRQSHLCNKKKLHNLKRMSYIINGFVCSYNSFRKLQMLQFHLRSSFDIFSWKENETLYHKISIILMDS